MILGLRNRQIAHPNKKPAVAQISFFKSCGVKNGLVSKISLVNNRSREKVAAAQIDVSIAPLPPLLFNQIDAGSAPRKAQSITSRPLCSIGKIPFDTQSETMSSKVLMSSIDNTAVTAALLIRLRGVSFCFPALRIIIPPQGTCWYNLIP